MGFKDPVIDPLAILRKLVKEKITFTMCEGPLAEFDERLEEVCDWIADQMGLTDNKVFGLTPAQVFHLKALYEARTGKKAEDI